MDSNQNCPPNDSADAVLLTRQQAAARLGTTERHVRRLVERGILTSVRLGGKVRIRAQDLNACIDGLPNSSPVTTTSQRTARRASATTLESAKAINDHFD